MEEEEHIMHHYPVKLTKETHVNGYTLITVIVY